MTDARTIVFFPEGAYGPTNNCAGIGQVLRERGHRVVFIVEESFAGTLEAKGFEERLMRLGPAPGRAGGPGPVLDRLHPRHGAGLPQADDRAARSFIAPTSRRSIDGAKYVHPRLLEIFDELAPDVIVQDNVVAFPTLAGIGPAVGPDRVVQPGRAQGSRRRAVLVGLPGGGSDRLAGASSRRCAGRMASCGPTSMRSVASAAMTASCTTSSGRLRVRIAVPSLQAGSASDRLHQGLANSRRRTRSPSSLMIS